MMNGSVFFRFTEKGGRKYTQCPDTKQAVIEGILKMMDLLDKFISMQEPLVFESTLSKTYYDEVILFQNNHKNESGLSDDAVRYALYAFIYRFGIPSDYTEKNAYSMWKRFVFNIISNSDFAGRREDACEAFVFFQGVIDSIKSCDEASILTAISKIQPNESTAAIRHQLKEEILKAELIQNANWRKGILDAEDYFNDGQIGFILQYSTELGKNCDILKFQEYYGVLCELFDSNKRLKVDYDEEIFEKVMMCMPDSTEGSTGHLLKQSNSKTSWGFLGRNYKDFFKNTTEISKRAILKCLLDKLRGTSDYKATLNTIVNTENFAHFKEEEKWKVPFIKEPLFNAMMGDYKFKNCINLSSDNSEVLLIAGTTVRAYSMELNTFLFYLELRKANKDVSLILSTTATLTDHEGFPMRYIEGSDYSLGYSYAPQDIAPPYIYKDITGSTRLSLIDLRKKLI